MRSVSELYGKHAGEDIYVVGTGPSLRVFPKSFLDGRITIGLNMAWKSVSVRYAITIHPDLNIPRFIGAESGQEITWVLPYEKTRALVTPEQFAWADANCHSFSYNGRKNTQPPNEPSDAGRITQWLREPVDDKLYVWSSIAQTGANLAANMGARNVILVGCDNGPMGQNHHSHYQHTRWKGADPAKRYLQYREGIAEVRLHLRDRGVNVVSLQPFLGVSNFEEDFARLCDELERPHVVPTVDLAADDTDAARVSISRRAARHLKNWMTR